MVKYFNVYEGTEAFIASAVIFLLRVVEIIRPFSDVYWVVKGGAKSDSLRSRSSVLSLCVVASFASDGLCFGAGTLSANIILAEAPPQLNDGNLQFQNDV